jgi:hypothetical protein
MITWALPGSSAMGTARKFANEHACTFKLFNNIFMDYCRAAVFNLGYMYPGDK